MKNAFASRNLRAALIVLAVLVCYFPALRAGLIWDDRELFAENPLMREPDGLEKIWSGVQTPDYFPVTMTSFWIETRIWGEHPAAYHALNILLHAGSALLLWLILLRLGVPGAFFAALLFAVHPVCVASVAWISERKNTLSLFFCFFSLLFWLLHGERKEKNRMFLLLALAAFLLALLCKTSVVMLPVVLVMLAWWRNGRITRDDLLRAAPFFLASLLLGLVTIAFQHHALADVPESLALKVARIGWSVGFYAGKVFWPFNLCLVYPLWNIDPATALAWLPTLMLAGVFAALLLLRKTWARHVLMGGGYFVVMLVPVSGIIWMNFLKQSWVADWWQYPAMPGLLALFAAGWVSFFNARGRMFLWMSCALLVACLGILTWRGAGTYQSLVISSRHTLARNPRAWGIRSNLARELVSQGHTEEAVTLCREGLQLDPHDMITLDNLGRTLVGAGRFGEAFPYCLQIVQMNPNYAAGHVNLAVAMVGLKHFDDASAEFYKAVNLQPGRIDYRLKLIRSLALAGHLEAASQEAQNTLRAAQLTGQHNGLDELAALTAAISKALEKRASPTPAH